MGDTWVTDLQHYLGDDGFFAPKMPGPARKIAEHMASIVEAATTRPAGERWAAAALRCRRRPRRKACPGRLVVRRTEVPAEIEWRCPRCADNGFIRGFEATPWDLSPSTADGPRMEEHLSYDELAAILEGSGEDIDLRAVGMRARDTGSDAVIDVAEYELEPFVDALAGAANDSGGKRRELIDAVFDRFNGLMERLDAGAAPSAAAADDDADTVSAWRIEEMEVWGRDYLDMEVEAFIKFDVGGFGSFQFGLMSGDLEYECGKRDGNAAVEWSWVGADESDEATGRGWAIFDGDYLRGRIYIHRGDNSAFTAVRRRPSR